MFSEIKFNPVRALSFHRVITVPIKTIQCCKSDSKIKLIAEIVNFAFSNFHQMSIQESDDVKALAVGVVFDDYNGYLFPGWDDETVGYQVNNGKIFDMDNPDNGRDAEGMYYHPVK